MKKPEEMTAAELIAAFDIQLTPDSETVRIPPHAAKQGVQVCGSEDAFLSVIRQRKPEIIEHINAAKAAKQRAFEEREAKIAAIPGLKELDAAYNDLAKWHDEFDCSFEGEGAVGGMGVRPSGSPREPSEAGHVGKRSRDRMSER